MQGPTKCKKVTVSLVKNINTCCDGYFCQKTKQAMHQNLYYKNGLLTEKRNALKIQKWNSKSGSSFLDQTKKPEKEMDNTAEKNKKNLKKNEK